MFNRRDFIRTSLAITAAFQLTDICAAQQPGKQLQPKQLPAQPLPAKQPPANKPVARFSIEEAKRTIKLLEPLHEHKKQPQPGDWLAVHGKDKDEQGQSFDEYLRGRKRTIEQYTRLYLLPLGTFGEIEQKMIDQVVDGMTCFFGLPTTQLKADPVDKLPGFAQRESAFGQKQLLSLYLIDTLLPPRRPKDAAALLGLTNVDLWPGEGWNFVFGQASLGTRVGVWSTARYGNSAGTEEERKLFFLRLLKVALHETGHMFGIPHCTAYECGMNGSNSLSESDRHVLEFCPECQAKLWWTNDYAPKKRCAAMLEYCKKAGLEEEAKYYTGLSAVL